MIIVNLNDFYIVLNLHECMEARFHHWKKRVLQLSHNSDEINFFTELPYINSQFRIFCSQLRLFSPELWDMNLQLRVNV